MRVVVAKKPFKGCAVGSEIDVSAKDARVLIAVGRAAPVVAAIMEAEAVAEAVVAEPKQEKRTYRRRDLSAEG